MDHWNNYICETWPQDAQTAFSYAAGIWGGYLNSPSPIVIKACWTDMGSSFILGYGGAANMPVISGTAYPQALANILYTYDTNGASPEIAAAFNKTFNWYFGTDGQTPGGEVDFVSVVLHEICHGLGFLGMMDVSGSQGNWGAFPAIFDTYSVNGAGQGLLNESLFPNPSNALYLQLTGNNVFFNGPQTVAANGGSPAKLYAPSSWNPGSSYSHLDYNTYRLTPNALMVYMMSTGTSIHAPGPVTLGMLRDMGWTITQPGLPPAADFSGAPTAGTAPFQVIFTDLSTNGPTSWLWDFGDGETSTLQDSPHTFKSPGSFTVSLTATNISGSGSLTKNAFISVSPCGNGPVRRTGYPDYDRITDAYGAINVDASDTIYLQAVQIVETLTFAQDKTVTLRGGYTCDYSSIIPDTIISASASGDAALTISSGLVTIDGIVIR
jgi:PKD repeat protein